MPARILARRYAKAMLELSIEADQIDDVGEQLKVLAEALLGDSRSINYWYSERIGFEEKRNTLQDILEAMDASAIVRNTANLMLERRRLPLFRVLVNVYHEMANEHSKMIDARVTSAVELSAEQLEEISAALGQSFGKRVHVIAEVDPSLLGGIVVQTEDRIIDGSVRGRLAALAQSIM
jgi:F-type H+-transporting ATPase subunit delta